MSILHNPSSDVYKLIVLDDEVKVHKIIQKYFEKEHLQVTSILNPDELFQENLNDYDAILIDFYYNGYEQNGLEIIKSIRKTNKFINIILMTGFSSEDLAIQAIKYDIDDYILKPVNGYSSSHSLGLG